INPVCSAVNFTLSLQNTPTSSGITYQWQSSPDNITWSNITGATSATYTGSQTSSSYYQCLVTCSGNTGTSTPLQVNLQTGVGCLTYCSSAGTSTADEELYSITVNGASTPAAYANANGCATVAPGPGSILSRYSNFKTIGNLTTLTQGATVPFILEENECDAGTYYANGMAIWVDWNQNGSFTDSGEQMYTEATTTTGPRTVTNSFIVPAGATLGQTIMRIVVAEGYSGATLTPCSAYSYGETEDWVVNVIASSPCAGTPTPGNTISSSNPICVGVNFTLSAQNITTGSGVTYQWQSSPDNITWTNISGATSSTFTGTQTVATYYQCLVTCSGITGTSTALLENMQTGAACLVYCTTSLQSGYGPDITNVTLNTLNNTSTYAGTAPGYVSYPATGTTTTSLMEGVSYTGNLTVSVGTSSYSSAISSVWIDYNQSGTFEASEWVQPFTAATSGSITINVPVGAALGLTKMRVRIRGNGNTNGSGDACTNFGSGETEDYWVTIIAAPICSGTPTPGNAVANPASVAPGGTTILSLSTPPAFSGLTYQWYSSPDNSTWTAISGANSSTYAATVPSNTYYQCLVTCSGSTGTSASVLVSMSYCYPVGSTTYYLSNFNTVGGITNIANTTGASPGGYFNYSSTLSCSQLAGSAITFNLTETGGTSYFYGWIDWNNDLDFADAGEAIFATSSYAASYSGAYTVPAGTAAGNYRMRVANSDLGTIVGPCGPWNYGEYEDYTFTVAPPPLPTITSLGSTNGCPGGSLIINGTNLLGTTSVTIGGTAATITANTATSLTVNTGTGTTGTITVTTGSGSVTSTETYTFYAVPTATATSNSPICEGATLNLTGSTDIGTSYSWAGPNGFTATTQNGSVSSAGTISTGTYSFTATSNGCFSVGTTSVTVNAIPSSVTANSSNSSICNGSSIDLTASGNSNGNTTMSYTEGFETFPPSGWTFINAGTGNQWTTSPIANLGASSMNYAVNAANAANAWGITQGISLLSGITYNISFYYGTLGGASYPENLKVTVGNSPTVAAQTTVLWDTPSITVTSWTQATFTYTPSISGNYYFGFNCYSVANMDHLFVDDFSVSGGTINPPTYSWTSLPAGYSSTNQNPTNVIPTGTTEYIVTAQNIYGCTNTASTTVTVNTPPVPSVSVTDNCGNSVLTASAYTGTLLWSTGESTSSITVSSAGTYTVAQVLGGCTSTSVSGIAAPITIPVAPAVSIVDNCGSSTLTASAYTGSLLWSSAESTASITTNSAGTFTVTQTENGCTSIAGSGTAAPIAIPVAPTVSVTDNCGNSTLTASSFTGTLLWSSGESTASITTTTAGTFTVEQTENGCTSIDGSGTAAPLTIPVASITSSIDPTSCTIANGSATASGGTIYTWSTTPVQTTATATGLAAGVYTVTVSDGSCESTASVNIAAPGAPSAPSVSIVDNCGNSTITASGFTGTLLWSTGESTSSITATNAGTYNVTQTVNGCLSAPATIIAAPITIPSAPSVTVSNNCGTSTLTASGYTGTLLWSSGESTSSITTTSAGNFTVTQTENGCTSIDGFGTAAPIAIPVTLTISVTDSCGTSTLTASGYTGSLLWSSGESTASIITTSGGNFTVTQTENGCASIAASGTAAPIAIPVAPTVNVVNNCGNSVMTASAYTGTLLWNTGETTSSISTTVSGTFSVSQTENGCTSILNTVNTVPLTIPTVSLGNDTTICASQAITIDAGNAGSSFAWNPNGQSTQTITVDSTGLGLGATTISVMVTDINLCVSSDTIVITFDPCTGIVENNVTNFNVVPNPSNGEFYLTVSGISEITNINIYNMNGQIIYKEEIKTDFNNKLINLQSYPKGMYFIRLNSKNNSYTEKIIID
ncbi:MAG: T9SS type A sorting domain-containing protein, partial [Bacteroidetes bacterium]|nr:T9SS type A sorting domain-containing protein [Bacteroidota bacterium]